MTAQTKIRMSYRPPNVQPHEDIWAMSYENRFALQDARLCLQAGFSGSIEDAENIEDDADYRTHLNIATLRFSWSERRGIVF